MKEEFEKFTDAVRVRSESFIKKLDRDWPAERFVGATEPRARLMSVLGGVAGEMYDLGFTSAEIVSFVHVVVSHVASVMDEGQGDASA
jgi:hypothetical protein